MSESTFAPSDPEGGPITLDQIRGKALAIRDEVKEEISETVAQRRNQILAVGVVAVVAIIGVAYLLGSRAGRRAVAQHTS